MTIAIMQQPNGTNHRNSAPGVQRHSRTMAPDNDVELSIEDLAGASDPIARGSNSSGRPHNSEDVGCEDNDQNNNAATEERRKRLSSMKQQHQQTSMRNLMCHQESNSSLDAGGTAHSRKNTSLRGLIRKTSTRFLMLGESASSGSGKKLGDSTTSFDTMTSNQTKSTVTSSKSSKEGTKTKTNKDATDDAEEPHPPRKSDPSPFPTKLEKIPKRRPRSERFQKGDMAELLAKEGVGQDDNDLKRPPKSRNSPRRSLSRGDGTSTVSKDPPLRRVSSDNPRRRCRKHTTHSPKPPSLRHRSKSDSTAKEDDPQQQSFGGDDSKREDPLPRPSLSRARSHDARPRRPSRIHTPSPKRSSGRRAGADSFSKKDGQCRDNNVEGDLPQQHSRRSLSRTRAGAPCARMSSKDAPMRRTLSDKPRQRSTRNLADPSPKRSSRQQRTATATPDDGNNKDHDDPRTSGRSLSRATRSGNAVGTTKRCTDKRRSLSEKPRRTRNVQSSSMSPKPSSRKQRPTGNDQDDGGNEQDNPKPSRPPVTRTRSSEGLATRSNLRRTMSDLLKPHRQSSRSLVDATCVPSPSRGSSMRHSRGNSLARDEHDEDVIGNEQCHPQPPTPALTCGRSGKLETKGRSSRKQRIADLHGKGGQAGSQDKEPKEDLGADPPRRSLLDIQAGGVVGSKSTAGKKCKLLGALSKEVKNTLLSNGVGSNHEPADSPPKRTLGKQLSSRLLLGRNVSGPSRKATSTEAA